LVGWLKSLLPSIGTPATFSESLLANVNSNLFFYNGIAFMIIFTIVSILCHWGIRQLNWIKRIPVVGTVDKIAGGLNLIFDWLFDYLRCFTNYAIISSRLVANANSKLGTSAFYD
jgi:hypothetical protein